MPSKLHIISAGTSLGSFSAGVERGPEALLAAGLKPALQPHYDLEFHSAPEQIGQSTPSSELVTWLADLTQELRALPVADRVVVLGGDHSVGAPSMLASAQRLQQPAVVYIDAHPDCHLLETSQTGSLHGMPVTIATGETYADVFSAPYLQPSDLCFVGIKDIDQAEQRWLDGRRVKYFTMDMIIDVGIAEVSRQLTKWIAGRNLHVSFDIDSIDAQYAPGTGINNMGGLTYREASYLCRQLGLLHPQVIDMVEVNPDRDQGNKTALLGTELIAALLGIRWDEYARYVGEHV